MEVGLLHSTILDGDLAPEGATDAENDAAPDPKTTEEDAAEAASEGRPRAPGFTLSDSRKSFRLRGVDTERKGGFTAFILQRSHSPLREVVDARARTTPA